jgi:septal ring factor EnvC (AmiA/AmiB activator)
MNLVADFAKLDEFEEFRVKISSLEQRMEDLEMLKNTRSGLLLEVEKERNRAQQYLAVVEDKTREIDKLIVALRTAQDEAEEERERQYVLIARLRASVCFNRTRVFRIRMIVSFENFGHFWSYFRS